LGLGFGSFFLCLVVCLFFFFFALAACLCVFFFGFITSCSHSLFFTKKLNDYLSTIMGRGAMVRSNDQSDVGSALW
jgi:hypothetical protein